MTDTIEELRDAYYVAAAAAEAAYRASDDAYSAAYRVADAATAADRVAVAAWDEYQSALKAKGGGE
jgi:hypothetical protein